MQFNASRSQPSSVWMLPCTLNANVPFCTEVPSSSIFSKVISGSNCLKMEQAKLTPASTPSALTNNSAEPVEHFGIQESEVWSPEPKSSSNDKRMNSCKSSILRYRSISKCLANYGSLTKQATYYSFSNRIS